MPEDGF